MTGDEQRQTAQQAEEQREQLSPAEELQVDLLGAVVTGQDEPPLELMKIDLHCHSEASADCITPIAQIPARCEARAIRVQAITDHNEIWGAQKLQELVAAT